MRDRFYKELAELMKTNPQLVNLEAAFQQNEFDDNALNLWQKQ